jgi:hypothetical protein
MRQVGDRGGYPLCGSIFLAEATLEQARGDGARRRRLAQRAECERALHYRAPRRVPPRASFAEDARGVARRAAGHGRAARHCAGRPSGTCPEGQSGHCTKRQLVDRDPTCSLARMTTPVPDGYRSGANECEAAPLVAVVDDEVASRPGTRRSSPPATRWPPRASRTSTTPWCFRALGLIVKIVAVQILPAAYGVAAS